MKFLGYNKHKEFPQKDNLWISKLNQLMIKLIIKNKKKTLKHN